MKNNNKNKIIHPWWKKHASLNINHHLCPLCFTCFECHYSQKKEFPWHFFFPLNFYILWLYGHPCMFWCYDCHATCVQFQYNSVIVNVMCCWNALDFNFVGYFAWLNCAKLHLIAVIDQKPGKFSINLRQLLCYISWKFCSFAFENTYLLTI